MNNFIHSLIRIYYKHLFAKIPNGGREKKMRPNQTIVQTLFVDSKSILANI